MGKRSVTSSAVLILFFCFCAEACCGQQAITISDGAKEWTDSALVLQLGSIAVNSSRELSLSLAHPAESSSPNVPHIWVFCEGAFLSCSWEDKTRTDTERVLSSPAKLHITFTVPAAQADPKTGEPTILRQPAHILIVDKARKLVKVVVVDYQLFLKERFSQTFTTGRYASGEGKGKSDWYDVCSGPPLTGYVMSSQSFSVVGDDNRACSNYADCNPPTRSSDGGFCAQFRLQGKEAVFPDPDQVKHGFATLVVESVLIHTDARLGPTQTK